MDNYALLVRLKAKEGKEAELEEFLKSALPLAQAEEDTNKWFALKLDESTYGIFDTFTTEEGRQKHLDGEIAKALMEKADELLSEEPQIEQVEILASK